MYGGAKHEHTVIQKKTPTQPKEQNPINQPNPPNPQKNAQTTEKNLKEIRMLQKWVYIRSKEPWQLSICLKKQASVKLYENRASTEHYLPKILSPALMICISETF